MTTPTSDRPCTPTPECTNVRTPITTIPELEALPWGSVVLDGDADAWQRGEDGWTCTDRAGNTVDQPSSSLLIYAPLTILWPIPAPTVKPGREEVAKVINPRPWGYRYEPFREFGEARSTSELIESDREDVRLIADAVLAILPGRSEADVRAGALRDAADAIEARRSRLSVAANTLDPGRSWSAAFIRDLADEEAGK